LVSAVVDAEASLREQIDTVLTVQKFVREHPKTCKVVSLHGEAKGRPHECGSERCVSIFLGETNWSDSKVHRIIQAGTKQDPFVVSKVAPVGTKAALAMFRFTVNRKVSRHGASKPQGGRAVSFSFIVNLRATAEAGGRRLALRRIISSIANAVLITSGSTKSARASHARGYKAQDV
jgi:hypothetical protein